MQKLLPGAYLAKTEGYETSSPWKLVIGNWQGALFMSPSGWDLVSTFQFSDPGPQIDENNRLTFGKITLIVGEQLREQ
jgi:hypothetical protein